MHHGLAYGPMVEGLYMSINGTARGTCRMADDDREDISEVMIPSEEVHPDHREHAKTPKHLDDDELDQRSANR
jgi:hypothetical protein